MKYLSYFLISTVFLLMGLFSQPAMAQTEAEKQAITAALFENDRIERDRFFREDPDSPLTREQKENFDRLNYFPIDLDYKVSARLNRDEDQGSVPLNMSDNSTASFIKYGKVTFSLMNTVVNLNVFRDQNLPELADTPGQLFIPFTDKTTGTETSRFGRYLILDKPANEMNFMLDLNKVINPFREYNQQYISVTPPTENIIPLPLKAGEKKFKLD